VLTATTHSDFFHEAQWVFGNGAKTVKSSKTFHLGIENDSGAHSKFEFIKKLSGKGTGRPI
jgi:hypothetical protein